MKKILTLLLAAALGLSLAACGSSPAPQDPPAPPDAGETPAVPEAQPQTPAESPQAEADYAALVPEALQGVWGDTGVQDVLSLYCFKGDGVETYVVHTGAGAASVLSGTFSVGDGRVNYDFGGSTGYARFTYENGALSLSNANNVPMTKLSAADLLEELTREEQLGNSRGVICLADLLTDYYGDCAESSAAAGKREAAAAALQAAGEAALQNLTTEYDKVQQLTWYQHKNQPQYTDTCCYIYPYIGQMDSGETWLRVALNYTDAATDAGWIFFNNVIFSIDGENTTRTFSRSEIVRDNDTEVWEIADYAPSAEDIQVLKAIASSTETIIRFQGDEYYADHTVTDREKAAITDVLTAYDFLKTP